jgi:hypothetical protein
MSIKKGTAPKTILANLTIQSLGESLTMDVTFHNRTRKELEAKIEAGATVAEIVLFLVKDWDSDFALTKDGLEELESEREGTCLAVWQGFTQARAAQLVKN